MRYRQLRLRYTMLYTGRSPRPVGEVLWRFERTNPVMAQPHWHPDTDVCETAAAITAVIDLAGVAEEDTELLLFQDALVVQGQRHLPACDAGSLYLAVAIRQGPFRVEIPLPGPVDANGVEARFDKGLLQIRLPKATAETAR